MSTPDANDRRSPQQRRDEGSVLPLVLVLMIIGAMIVMPVLDYTIAVFKSNRVVSDRTAQSEAAKGGLRMVLGDPKNVFLTCDGGGNLTPADPVVNGIAVSTTCTELEEVGPAAALGYAVPKGAVATQLGAQMPVSLSGTTASSGPAYPYPASPDWWATPAAPDPNAQYSATAEEDLIWMPDLPRIPSAEREATPFDMPPAFDCKVFFPGRYDDPIDLSGNIYFTSGVYYFEEPITLADDANVVVGYGLEDFTPASDCADDLQVASNVINPPTTYDISGGGATWVFGANARLVIDNSAMAAGASIRFNQRYDSADRGGRISIMTVNGDDASNGDHEVTHVNRIPRSLMLNDIYEVPIDGTGYQVSSSTYTDKARLPEAPANVEDDEFRTSDPAPNGGVVLTWDEVTGQAAGGSLLGEQDNTGTWITSPYEVQIRRRFTSTWSDICPPDELLITPAATAGDPNVISCVVTGLDATREYDVRIRTVNEIGTSPWEDEVVRSLSGAPVVTRPGPVLNVAAVDGASDDVAQVSWDAPIDNGGVPITEYTATAYRVALVPHANVPPVAAPVGSEVIDLGVPLLYTTPLSATAHVRAYDPNGDDLALTIDTTGLPPEIVAVADDTTDTIEVTLTGIPLSGAYAIPYVVTDPDGQTAAGELAINLIPLASLLEDAPQAEDVQVLADVGVPVTVTLPVSDRDGMPLDAVPVTVDTTGLDADWNVSVTDLAVTIETVAPDGDYTIPYTVTDADGNTANAEITVTIARDVQPVGSCSVTPDPGVPMENACEINLPDLVPGTPTLGNVGYRFEVIATNAAGSSDPAVNADPLPLAFDGTGVGLLPPAPRLVTPWVPEAILDIEASNGSAPVSVAIAGYVAVPMGQVKVENPHGFDIRINGGVMAGTFAINDARDNGTAGSVPIGFKNDIVLQRKVRIVSVAGNVRSTAIVELNEDGAGYAVNTWTVG
jgi:hypothetical protein